MIKVTAAVMEKDGKVLIAKRKNTGRFARKWEFPGGKMNPGETPERCLERELLEELGIRTKIGEFICSSVYDYGHIAIELLAYRVSHVSGTISLYDHECIEWVFPSDLPRYDFPEADIPIIARLIEESHPGES